MKLTRCDQYLFGVNKRSVAAERPYLPFVGVKFREHLDHVWTPVKCDPLVYLEELGCSI